LIAGAVLLAFACWAVTFGVAWGNFWATWVTPPGWTNMPLTLVTWSTRPMMRVSLGLVRPQAQGSVV